LLYINVFIQGFVQNITEYMKNTVCKTQSKS